MKRVRAHGVQPSSSSIGGRVASLAVRARCRGERYRCACRGRRASSGLG
ncbi:hypothetical protein SZ55_0921 [Pseudomonas sp. FeS53a]|nr:hypothetical protein SZ55_0921 [Pseudomonas sp. FeS53a]